MKIECKNCHKLFEPFRHNQIYCNVKCAEQFRAKDPKRKIKRYNKVKEKRKLEQSQRNKKGVFSKDEIKYIVKNYNKKSLDDISLNLDRTKQSVESKILLLIRDKLLSKKRNTK